MALEAPLLNEEGQAIVGCEVRAVPSHGVFAAFRLRALDEADGVFEAKGEWGLLAASMNISSS